MYIIKLGHNKPSNGYTIDNLIICNDSNISESIGKLYDEVLSKLQVDVNYVDLPNPHNLIKVELKDRNIIILLRKLLI